MAFDAAASLAYVQTALKALNLFYSVEVERPGQPRGEGPSATLHIESVRVVETRLTGPIEQHLMHVVIWRAMNTLGGQAQELEAQSVTGQVMDYFYQHFTVGGAIRAVDIGGEYGDVLSMTTDARNLDETQARYFVADITVPLIVDSATVFAAA